MGLFCIERRSSFFILCFFPFFWGGSGVLFRLFSYRRRTFLSLPIHLYSTGTPILHPLQPSPRFPNPPFLHSPSLGLFTEVVFFLDLFKILGCDEKGSSVLIFGTFKLSVATPQKSEICTFLPCLCLFH